MKNTDKKKDTEKDILEAAKKVFIEKGYAGARMQAIADEAQINKAMLHYYYRSKEALFNRIMEDIVIIMANQFLPALTGEVSVLEKVERLVDGYTDTVTKNPHIPIFVLNELSQNQLKFQENLKSKLEANDVFPNFIQQIKEEQEKGILRPIAPHHFMLTVMSLIVFPFVAKPVFVNMLKIPQEKYSAMMQERKQIVMNVVKSAFQL